MPSTTINGTSSHLALWGEVAPASSCLRLAQSVLGKQTIHLLSFTPRHSFTPLRHWLFFPLLSPCANSNHSLCCFDNTHTLSSSIFCRNSLREPQHVGTFSPCPASTFLREILTTHYSHLHGNPYATESRIVNGTKCASSWSPSLWQLLSWLALTYTAANPRLSTRPRS